MALHPATLTDLGSSVNATVPYWVEAVREAHQASPDIDHAIAMVRERDRERHPVFYADEDRVLKFDELSGVGANVHTIIRWLDKQG